MSSNDLNDYDLIKYISDVENNGLKKTWSIICDFVLNSDCIPEFLNVNNFGELYEIGLATEDKILKKKSGQYYTPDDVANVMATWLIECKEEVVCDVACGTGKLILTYLKLIGYENARKLISSGNLYLYDFDKTALMICKTIITVLYGKDISNHIHDIAGDFLDKNINLPGNCKVISNPPYAHIYSICDGWEITETIKSTKEYYSAFMEKVFKQSRSTVIITPFSFISGNKFLSLRKLMCDSGYGYVVAFDNVPGNIFCGRKHGIFNTNTANSVRAAITVFHQSAENHGFKVSSLIRFKNEEREKLLNGDILKENLSDNFQIIDESNKVFKKVSKNLNETFVYWSKKSNLCLNDCISKQETEFFLDIPNTCRYFTTASSKKLKRTGSISLYIMNKEYYDFIYCLINSSFAYWWWRIFDGGITYPYGLLTSIPIPFDLLTIEDKKFFNDIRNEMNLKEREYIVTKMNAGEIQENIKFPEEYRIKINNRILKILDVDATSSIFDEVHSNTYFRK